MSDDTGSDRRNDEEEHSSGSGSGGSDDDEKSEDPEEESLPSDPGASSLFQELARLESLGNFESVVFLRAASKYSRLLA